MRILTLPLVVFLASCSGSTGAGPDDSGAGGDGGEPAVPSGCERTDHLGSFTVHFEQVSGDCGTPLDERASYSTLEQTGPCERLEPDAWSDDDCTRRQHFQCSKVEFVTELTLHADGSLVGRETRIINGDCTGTYDVTLTRR